MNFKALLTVCIFVAGLIFVSYAESDAARFGKGRSFGSKPSMQKSMPAQSINKAPVAGATAGAAGAAATKPGLLGGMGGMFGGLLAGTLLGSMFAGGMGGMGGGLMNMLLIGVLVFIAYKLFQRFRSSRSVATSTASGPSMGSMQMPSQNQPMARQQTGSNWDNLQNASPQGAPAESQINMPQGFDADDFLRGAKMAYSRLQASWDKRDLSDLSQFVNTGVLDEIKAQLADDPNPSTTDILLVNAQLLEVKEDGAEQIALVYFDVLLREDPSQTTPTQIKEVWHFNRATGSEGSWKLDGIQQVE